MAAIMPGVRGGECGERVGNGCVCGEEQRVNVRLCVCGEGCVCVCGECCVCVWRREMYDV